MDCNQQNRASQLVNLSSSHPTARERELLALAQDQNKQAILGTLEALDRRLETIRKEQMAKNRSQLMQLDAQQLQTLEWVTTNITRTIFREVADELEHSASEGNGKRLSETVCKMLGLR